MKSISRKEFAKVLERNGWVAMNSEQHHIYGKQGSNVRLSIPVHGNQTSLPRTLTSVVTYDNLHCIN
jgi:predicted RNA binding protein YcfA (HicA-like mRNA interferase family)